MSYLLLLGIMNVFIGAVIGIIGGLNGVNPIMVLMITFGVAILLDAVALLYLYKIAADTEE